MRKLISEFVREVLAEKGRGKPGGPLTKMGAIKKLHPAEFNSKVSSAVADADGDVEDAAEDLGVAPRTLYHYLDDVPALKSVKTSSELGADPDGE